MTKTNMAIDTSHLDALRLRLSNERMRLAKAKGMELQARTVIVSGIERELAGELAFLGLESESSPVVMSDDELLAALIDNTNDSGERDA
jgi:hypothetical protein